MNTALPFALLKWPIYLLTLQVDLHPKGHHESYILEWKWKKYPLTIYKSPTVWIRRNILPKLIVRLRPIDERDSTVWSNSQALLSQSEGLLHPAQTREGYELADHKPTILDSSWSLRTRIRHALTAWSWIIGYKLEWDLNDVPTRNYRSVTSWLWRVFLLSGFMPSKVLSV